MLNGLDLFSGIGGMSVALSEWVRPVVYCEIDPYCQGVLLSRMADGFLPKAPIWDDITTFTTKNCESPSIQIIFGGFPCQDISVAGHGKGLAGERSGLFFEIARLAQEIRPRFIFIENVPAITTRGGLRVTQEIAEMGYDCRWCVISAASIGALHKRERWFLLAHSSSKRFTSRRIEIRNESNDTKLANSIENVADTMCERFEEKSGQPIGQEKTISMSTYKTEYDAKYKEPQDKLVMAGMANDVPNRLDRTRALGNAVVPAQAKEAFKILMGIK
jgi:DNA (cytosine-5)-methyltransferase 1